MKRILTLAAVCLLAAFSVFAQNPAGGYGPGTSSSGGGGLGSPALPSTSTLTFFNQFLDGTGTAGSDASGNGNVCTFLAGGQAPTWNPVANGGGINLVGSSLQGCSYPASVNSSKTFFWVVSFQPTVISNTLPRPPGYSSSGVTAGGQGYELLCLLCGTVTSTANDFVLAAAWLPGAGSGHIANYVPSSQLAYHPASVLENQSTDFYNIMAGGLEGTFVLSVTTGTTPDAWYLNGQRLISSIITQNSGNTPTQSSGVYQLGCSPQGNPYSCFTGTIYAAGGYSGQLTQPQQAQLAQALNSWMTGQRGVTMALGGTNNIPQQACCVQPTLNDPTDVLIHAGDSLSQAINFPIHAFSGTNPVYQANVAQNSTTCSTLNYRFPMDILPLIHPAAGRNAVSLWCGTNQDATAVQTANEMAQFCKQAHAAGAKCMVSTEISRTTADAFKDAMNPILRQIAPTFADLYIDLAGNVHFGADGANSNTQYYNVDAIHLNYFSDTNFIGPYFIHGFNYLFGNSLASGNFNTYSGGTIAQPHVLQFVDTNVNNTNCALGSGTTVTCQMPFNTTAGSGIIWVMNVVCASCSVNAPSDSQSLTWTAVAAAFNYGTNGYLRAYYNCNSATAAAETFTQTFTGTISQAYLSGIEVQGLAASCLDVASTLTAVAGTTGSGSTTSATTTVAGDFVVPYTGQWLYSPIAQIATWWGTTGSFPLQNNSGSIGLFGGIQSTAGATSVTVSQPAYYTAWNPWANGLVAFKAATATPTIQLQDVDCGYSEANTTSGSLNEVLWDATWLGGQTCTIKNATTSGSNTLTLQAPTPYQTGVQQPIITLTGTSVASLTVASGVTVKLRSTYSYTGTPGTNLSPVYTWHQVQ